MINKAPEKIQNLYEVDYNAWLKLTIERLKTSQFSGIDWVNVIEELEDMGRSEKRAIYSNLKILLLHLLKYCYQPEKRSRSWLSSICEHRQRLHRAFKDSPSLKNHFATILTDSYEDARTLAAVETGLDIAAFPKDSPFSKQEILDMDFLPS